MHCLAWIAAAALLSPIGDCHAELDTPPILHVRPSGAVVPANLLRISIEFATPVTGEVLSRLALVHEDGSRIEAPFLQQELWSPDGTILTILMHPGRVKTGLVAREQLGPPLEEGERVALTLDGQPMVRWRVGAVDQAGPTTSAWTLSTVRPGSREPLLVRLDGAIDGRAIDYLAVADGHERKLGGRARLVDGETTWTFTPTVPWRAGRYELVARATLEDAAGNRLGGHFETPIAHPGLASRDERIPFRVSSARKMKGR
ncbi:hypothetical protein LJR289_002092 [Pseudoduganella sp. LjRoot289]|uniref:hypothetical protein n=1 Tax=Pseudoduganella sp. LjRoot289 TaxID=3342314 RepID=UPI003ECC9BC7